MEHTRREIVLGASAVTAGSLAGCLGTVGRDSDGEWALASFFTLADFTAQIVGDGRSVDNAVPSGQHGHGWDPQATMLPSIVESEAFVYLGVEGFQPWVDQAVEEVESNHGDDVVLIDALEGIDLLEYDGHGHNHDHETDHGHGEHAHELSVRAIQLTDRDTGETVVDAHADHWHGEPLAVPIEDRRSLGAILETDDGDAVDLGDEYALTARTAGSADLLEIESHGDHLHVRATEDGAATIVVQVARGDSIVWKSPALEVEAGAGADGDGADGHGHSHGGDRDDGHSHGDDEHGHDNHDHDADDGHGHDHSHGEYDAKFFSDPLLAKRGVENIRDALIDLDPDNADGYEANADDYLERLDDVHAAYEQRLADRTQDAVILAGHDSFQYLSDRYGFEIYTPYGLSPDDDPSSSEIADAVDFVEERGIEYVLWDYFDGDEDAELIAAEADTVIDTVMVSPAESVVEEWGEAGYGDYVGQMMEINLTAFETALGAV
ncbi:zinc ABC transporter solute-binding protein [Natronorubrum sp. JWXQ-INN-674]|uniref:Zinc ABC transporter solute-binding protein n=1 Tax=Natronorubrum halalkaliphilum TaxID=2691917 RepID=A0A6B0VKE0_9EURY|nr:zinc ABC transporter substrate-binding protein [Natronorubrum halalkaliphilum]MXV62311.1 zinc ABC transporter solute-binding protein [Natronorubrum halalkaliphilum]